MARTWVLEFRPVGDGPPSAIRVRKLLKAALRAYGLRCVDFRTRGRRGPIPGRRPVQRKLAARPMIPATLSVGQPENRGFANGYR